MIDKHGLYKLRKISDEVQENIEQVKKSDPGCHYLNELGILHVSLGSVLKEIIEIERKGNFTIDPPNQEN